MFDVWSAVEWWDEWQLRILVLGSLGIQWFLLLAAPMRKYTIPHVLRTLIWLAYVSSDALAIYALATLFNRHARATTSSSSSCGCTESKASILEVLWAPILLIHLGGQEELTAYNIEDNELWIRHTVTLVSQVMVALYAFYKSWPSRSDWRLLASAILLFIIGVLSFSEKPWALKKASIYKLAAVSAAIQGTKKRTRLGVYLDELVFFNWCNCFIGGSKNRQEDKVHLTQGDKVHMILSDMSLSAAADDLVKRKRAGTVEGVLRPLSPEAELELKRWLRGAFGFIYTRANVVFTPVYLAYHLVAVPTLHIAALTLFATSDKHQYNRIDIKTTYILFCFTAALDVFAVFIRQLLYWVMSELDVPALCETVPGYNLVEAVILRRKKDIGWVIRCAMRLGIKEEYFTCSGDDDNRMYKKVSGMVLADLVKAQDRDLASYRNFTVPPEASEQRELDMEHIWTAPTSDEQLQHAAQPKEMEITPISPGRNDIPMVPRSEEPDPAATFSWYSDMEQQPTRVIKNKKERRNWVLSEELQKVCGPEIRDSLQVSFDRSVLVWHIATDFCFRMQGDMRPPPSHGGLCFKGSAEDDEVANPLWLLMECTEAISNYMAHLLNFHPEMLLTGSRQHLLTEAIDELKREFKKVSKKLDDSGYKAPPKDREKKLTMDTITSVVDQYQKLKETSTYFHITEACRLARGLLDLPDDKTRWAVMYHVWLGMLCYSASMCRGYLHAKSLGEGGEFLSFVWLVLSLKGAKTLADKLQMLEGDDERTTPPTSSAPPPQPRKKRFAEKP